MKKRTLVAVAVAAFLAGSIAGGIAGSLVATRFTYEAHGRQLLISEALDARIKVRVLNDLREGRVEDAVGIVEALLDSNVISLTKWENLFEGDNEAIGKAVDKVQKYREKYPRRTENETIDRAVGEVLNAE